MARTRNSRIAIGAVAVLAVLAAGVVGGIAYANHTPYHKTFSGGGGIAVRVATDSADFSTSGTNTWENVPGSTLQLRVPDGKRRLVRAEFTAETATAPTGAWCAVRVVAVKSGTSTAVEFNPRAGQEFAFDSASGTDSWEGHAMKRALVLNAGTWNVRVQAAAVGDGADCGLDDWYFDIEAHPLS